jgi:hypothetical protein
MDNLGVLQDFIHKAVDVGYIRFRAMPEDEQLECMGLYLRHAGRNVLTEVFQEAVEDNLLDIAAIWHRGLFYPKGEAAIPLNSYITEAILKISAKYIDEYFEDRIQEIETLAEGEHPSLTAGERNR